MKTSVNINLDSTLLSFYEVRALVLAHASFFFERLILHCIYITLKRYFELGNLTRL